jgi:DNA-binding HxlR family transcriptional regulator
MMGQMDIIGAMIRDKWYSAKELHEMIKKINYQSISYSLRSLSKYKIIHKQKGIDKRYIYKLP